MAEKAAGTLAREPAGDLARAEDLGSMQELRAAIDALDGHLIALLAVRAGYIERAISLKPAEAIPARVPDRVDAVLANVRARAIEAGLSPVLAERLWAEMIEFFIAREEEVLGKETP